MKALALGALTGLIFVTACVMGFQVIPENTAGMRTRTDLSVQGRNPIDLFRPGFGTILVCQPNTPKCESVLNGAFVLYRARAPQKPGACGMEGTGALATDKELYLYLCSPTYVKADSGEPTTKWVRSREPFFTDTW